MANPDTLKGIAMTLRVIAKRPDPAESARTLRMLADVLERLPVEGGCPDGKRRFRKRRRQASPEAGSGGGLDLYA